MSALPPLIFAQDLRRAFPQGAGTVEVLRGVDLAVPPGGITVVLGPSGSGKSTLLNLLGGLERPSGGALVVAGLDLVAAGPADLLNFRRNTVSFVFQAHNLLPTLTAMENVAVGLEPQGVGAAEGVRRAAEALESVGLSAMAARFPGQLSGGEQQRVALARALARRPKLLLADEPTAALDRRRADQVIDLLRALHEQLGADLLIVTHDVHFRRIATRVISLEDGVVASVEPGPRAETP